MGRSTSGRNTLRVSGTGGRLFVPPTALEVKTPSDVRPSSQMTSAANTPLSQRMSLNLGGVGANGICGGLSAATTGGGGESAFFSNLKRSLSKNSLMNSFKNLSERERRRVKVEIIRGSAAFGNANTGQAKEAINPRSS